MRLKTFSFSVSAQRRAVVLLLRVSIGELTGERGDGCCADMMTRRKQTGGEKKTAGFSFSSGCSWSQGNRFESVGRSSGEKPLLEPPEPELEQRGHGAAEAGTESPQAGVRSRSSAPFRSGTCSCSGDGFFFLSVCLFFFFFNTFQCCVYICLDYFHLQDKK